MGVHILTNREGNMAVLYCSTSGFAFGPVIEEDPKSEWSAHEKAEFFLRWLPRDAREFGQDALGEALARFEAAGPVECGWVGCRCPGWDKRDRRPATAYDFDGTPNKAHADGFCSEDCMSAASEDADERNRDAYYGASTPQTEGERYAAAAYEKKKLG